MTQKKIPTKTIPFRGGVVSGQELSLIPSGGYSAIQNMRARHPGFEKRAGCRALHTSADGTNEVVTLFQFSKGRVSERHFYAQMGDGDVLEATANPPTVTTGAFGSEVFSGSSGQVPASWATLNDNLVYSNGVDQHQIYPGADQYARRVIVVKGSGELPTVPDIGEDYTEQATDGTATTVVVLDALDTLANYHQVFIRTELPATSIKFTVSKTNTSDAVAQIHYWNGAWTDSSMTDGTIATAGKTFGQTGSMAWTKPTDEIPHYMYNECGFWYRLSLASGALDAEVEISSIQYNTTWQGIQNVWDGVTTSPVEVSVHDYSASTYLTYGAAQVTADDITSADTFWFNTPDPIVGFFLDVGETPNTTGTTTINSVKYFNGTAMAEVANKYDGTSGISKSGWVTFSRQAAVQPRQFNACRYYSYWYSFTVDKTLSADVSFSIEVMPYFEISEFGYEGLCNCAWKDRMLYVFSRFPNDIAVSSKHRPLVLNGNDYTILDRPGDGRANRVICMKKIYNELLVWQEEKGVDGGCLTLYQGYSPETFGKLVLSTRYGTFSAKTAVVVDGIRMNINKTEDPPVSVAFFLSHYGVFMCDGKTVECISDGENSSIQNYFDPKSSVCIRHGYESKMWLDYDGSENCIRIGLVSGYSATAANVFPVYDIEDRAWTFDSLAQPFSCMANVEAGSGAVTAIQVAGGTADGLVYQSNYGSNDVSTAIDAHATMELDSDGKHFVLDEITMRMKAQTVGDCTVTPSLNGIAQLSIALSMVPEVTNQVSRRHKHSMNLISDHISLKFQNAVASQSIFLKDIGVEMKDFEGQ